MEQEKDEAFMERMAEAERVSRQQQQTFSMDALAMLGNNNKMLINVRENCSFRDTRNKRRKRNN